MSVSFVKAVRFGSQLVSTLENEDVVDLTPGGVPPWLEHVGSMRVRAADRVDHTKLDERHHRRVHTYVCYIKFMPTMCPDAPVVLRES